MKIANSPCCSTSPEVPLPSPKQPDIGSRVMSSAPPLAASMGKKKKKTSKDVTSDTPSVAATNASPTSSPIEDADSLTRAIQTALDHAQAAGVIPTSNPAIDQGEASSPKSKKRHATGTPDDSGSALPDGSQKKSKKKKTSVNSAATSSPGLSPAIANHTSSTATSNASQHIPGYLNGSHIPIDPALTVNDQAIQRHSHQSISNPNTPFTGALTPAAAAALQPQEATASGNYLFNQETDLTVLASNEDILRALQLEGFDMNKFAGALKSYTESLASANSAATSGHPQTNETGPSAGASLVTTPQPVAGPSGSGSKSRAKKVVAPQPGSQVVNPEHADILATHWLNPAKLAELVKDQGLVYKKGKFSAIEEHQIEAALQHYATAKNLTPSEIDAIIFSKGKKAKEEYSTFWSEITRAVPQRPIIAVYHHVRRTHHPMKQQGKWTPEEDAIVIAAVAELGQKWEQISLRVGRMSSDCRDRYRNHLVDQDARVVGPWTKEEEEELTKIVMELTVERGLQADNDVLWSEVSERMGGRRTRQQVRIKWTDALNKRVKNAGERPRWSAQDAYILVHKVASMPVQDDTEIDWKLLPDPQWNLWSAHQLQRRWYGLKKTLKDADTTPHSEIIAILQSKFRDPPEQPNASRRYETKKSRNIALGREFITDEDDNFDEFADTAGAHDLFSQSADGTPLDHDLVRAAQQQLEAVLEIASQQAAASGSGTRET